MRTMIQALGMTILNGNVIKYGSSGPLYLDLLNVTGNGSFEALATDSRMVTHVEDVPGSPLVLFKGSVYSLNVEPKDDSLSGVAYTLTGSYNLLFTQIYNKGLNVNVIATKPFVNDMNLKRSYEARFDGVSLISHKHAFDMSNSLFGIDLHTFAQFNGFWMDLGDESQGSLIVSNYMPTWQGLRHVNEKGEATSTSIDFISDLGAGPLELHGSFEDIKFDFDDIGITSDSMNEANSGNFEFTNVVLTYPAFDIDNKINIDSLVGGVDIKSNFYGGGNISFTMQTPAGNLSWSRNWEFLYRMREDYHVRFVTSGTPDSRILHVIDNDEEVASSPLGAVTQSILEGPGSRKLYGETAAQLTNHARMLKSFQQQKFDLEGGVGSVISYIGNAVNAFFSLFGLIGDYFNRGKIINNALGAMYQPVNVTANGGTSVKNNFIKLKSYIGNTLVNSSYWYGSVFADIFGGSELNESSNGYNAVIGTDQLTDNRTITINSGLRDIYDEYNNVTLYGNNSMYLDLINSNKPNY